LITLKFEFFFEDYKRSWLVRQDPDGRFLVEEKEAKKRGVGGSSVSSAIPMQMLASTASAAFIFSGVQRGRKTPSVRAG